MRLQMRSKSVLPILLPLFLVGALTAAFTRGRPQQESASLKEITGIVSRLLAEPVYTEADERLLNSAGDEAAVAVTRIVSEQDMNSPETGRRILLILHLAFEAPQSIVDSRNKAPTQALRLLDQLEQTDYGRQPNVIGNARFEIKHSTSTGQPMQTVTITGEPVIDWGHEQWLSNVLLYIDSIKPGMTRSDLLRVFTTEGGVSTRTRQTFVLKKCPTIKVDVDFSISGSEANDKIAQISKPYLDYGVYD